MHWITDYSRLQKTYLECSKCWESIQFNMKRYLVSGGVLEKEIATGEDFSFTMYGQKVLMVPYWCPSKVQLQIEVTLEAKHDEDPRSILKEKFEFDETSDRMTMFEKAADQVLSKLLEYFLDRGKKAEFVALF